MLVPRNHLVSGVVWYPSSTVASSVHAAISDAKGVNFLIASRFFVLDRPSCFVRIVFVVVSVSVDVGASVRYTFPTRFLRWGSVMRRIGLALLLLAAGLVWTTVPAGAVAHRAGARTATPAIAAGGSHSCALLANGTAKCWGLNSSGQLGNGTTTNASTPVVVSGLSTAVAITAGGAHSCAVLANGTAKCWGANGSGQLGNGTTTNASTPVVVTGLSTAVAIRAGSAHSCALLANGTAKCWGLQRRLVSWATAPRPTRRRRSS